MKVYAISLAVGLLVGIIYGLLNVRSPAPPVVALIGLLGMLIGEQVPPVVRHIVAKAPVSAAWMGQIKPHVFGHMPTGGKAPEKPS